MTNLIISRNEKKEAVIVYTMASGYRATISQIVNTGIGIEKDFVITKANFKTHQLATKWAIKNIN